MKKHNLYITGFMGTGKSIVGKTLAQKMGKIFIDVDTAIKDRQGKKIADIFDLVKISIDGSTQAIHEFHRGEGTFTKSLKAINLLIQHDAPVQIAMTVTKKNIHDIDAMTKKFGSRLTFAPLFVAGRAKTNKEVSITGKEYYEALASVDGVKPLSYLCFSLASSKQKRTMKCAFGDAEITLIVYYNYDDMVRANKAGEESPYIIIDGEPFKGDLLAHRTISDSKKWLGYIMVKLNRIGDPLISVGP